MRDDDFYKELSDVDSEDIEKYLRDLARLKKIREEEKLKEENKKLLNTINENNKKLEKIGQNIRKVEKKADKINIIGGDRSSKANNNRNIKRDINDDVESEGIKISLPKSYQKAIVRKSDTLIVQQAQSNKPAKKVVKKKVSKPATKMVIKS